VNLANESPAKLTSSPAFSSREVGWMIRFKLVQNCRAGQMTSRVSTGQGERSTWHSTCSSSPAIPASLNKDNPFQRVNSSHAHRCAVCRVTATKSQSLAIRQVVPIEHSNKSAVYTSGRSISGIGDNAPRGLCRFVERLW
jgi:hypothetical protein